MVGVRKHQSSKGWHRHTVGPKTKVAGVQCGLDDTNYEIKPKTVGRL